MDAFENAYLYHPISIKNTAKEKKRKAKKAKRLERQTKKEKELKSNRTEQHYLKALKKNKRRLIGRITEPEKTMRNILDYLGIKYNFQRIFTVKNKGYIVDFYLSDYLTVIEIDGVNHYEKCQDYKDHKRTEELLSLKNIINVLRFDNEDVLCMQADEFKRELAIQLCPFVEDLLQ